MCNHEHLIRRYLLPVERVYKFFNPFTPRNMEYLIAYLGDEIFGLYLPEGDSLYRFITSMTKEGNLKKTEKGYVLTKQGSDTLVEIEDWIMSLRSGKEFIPNINSRT